MANWGKNIKFENNTTFISVNVTRFKSQAFFMKEVLFNTMMLNLYATFAIYVVVVFKGATYDAIKSTLNSEHKWSHTFSYRNGRIHCPVPWTICDETKNEKLIEAKDSYNKTIKVFYWSLATSLILMFIALPDW